MHSHCERSWAHLVFKQNSLLENLLDWCLVSPSFDQYSYKKVRYLSVYALVLFEIEGTRGYLSILIILKNHFLFLFVLKTISFWFIHFLVAEELPIHDLKYPRSRWHLLLNLRFWLDIFELLGEHDVCYGKLVDLLGRWLLLAVFRLWSSSFWLIFVIYLRILRLKPWLFFLLWVTSFSLDIELRKYAILAILGCQLLSPSLPSPVLPFFFFLLINSFASLQDTTGAHEAKHEYHYNGAEDVGCLVEFLIFV